MPHAETVATLAVLMPQPNMPEIHTIDTSPKWFTEVEFNLRDRWTESTIQYVPMLTYDDSMFTRVEIDPRAPAAIPEPTPGE
jgi:hypothetical protein